MQPQNEQQPRLSGPLLQLQHDVVQPAPDRRRQRPAEPKQGRPGVTDGNVNGSLLQPFVRSESEPSMTSAVQLRHATGSTMPSSFTQQQQQPEWRRSNSLSRQRVMSNDPHGGGKIKGRADRTSTTKINYGWVDPGDDNDDDGEEDDDDDESDKENRPTFPRSFRPTVGHHSHLQQSAHQHVRRNAASVDSSTAESLHRRSFGDSFLLTTKFDQFSCDDGDQYVDVTRDHLNWRHPQQQQHAFDFWAGDRRSRTHGRLGTIEEVTELSSCSAAALQSAVDAVLLDGVDGDVSKSMPNENAYENRAAFGASPGADDAASAVNTSSIMETSPSSEGSSSPDTGGQTVPSSASRDDDDDEIDRRSAASTCDASVTFDRPQWCSGVLTFASGKSKFGKVGFVDLYRQRRRQQQQQQRGRREGGEAAVTANSSLDDGADWMSIASGCSSLTDAPPAKRQRLASFKVGYI